MGGWGGGEGGKFSEERTFKGNLECDLVSLESEVFGLQESRLSSLQ